MKRTDPEFQTLVERMRAGELSRPEAAKLAGIPLGTLNVWLSRSKLAGQLAATRRNTGPAHPFAEKNPDKVAAYSEAIELALRGLPVMEAFRKFESRGVNMQVLYRRVAKAKQEASGVTKPTRAYTAHPAAQEYLEDPKFIEAVDDVRTGKITQAEAARSLNLDPKEFRARLVVLGLDKILIAAAEQRDLETEAKYAGAVEELQNNPTMSVDDLLPKYPGLTRSALYNRLAKAKSEQKST